MLQMHDFPPLWIDGRDMATLSSIEKLPCSSFSVSSTTVDISGLSAAPPITLLCCEPAIKMLPESDVDSLAVVLVCSPCRKSFKDLSILESLAVWYNYLFEACLTVC